MRSKPIFLPLIIMAIFASGFSVRQAYGAACSSTPEQVVESIYTQLKANKSLETQVSHINVQFTNYDENGDNGAIKLQGWVESQGDYNKVVEIASGTSCVSRVNEQQFAPSEAESLMPGSGACDPPTTKECGDICIPGGETCNIGKSGG